MSSWRHVITYLTVVLAVSNCSSDPSLRDPWHANPVDVKFVNEDVPRFWQVYDRFSNEIDDSVRATMLQQAYFDPGSGGLTSYLRDFKISPELLLAAVDRNTKYYQHIREASLTFPDASEEQRIRMILDNLERLYPNAHFPDVYFVIGDTQTAGTITSEGLILGVETLARDPTEAWTAAPRHLIDMDFSRGKLPLVVAHELVHAQQKYYRGAQTVLFWIILEGVAEFVGELLTGAPASGSLHEYGNAHEAELWAEFLITKDDLGKGTWFSPAVGERPGGLGYYLGYQIVKSYYDRQPEPAQAVATFFNLEDYGKFLQDSGYAKKFE